MTNRRNFLVGSAAAFALSGCKSPFGGAIRHRSDYDGVQVGAITYSFRSMPGSGALDVLGYAVKSGLGTVELMGNTAETFVNISNSRPRNAAEREKVLAERLAVPESKWTELRRVYEDAGVGIRIVKFWSIGDPGISDAENDYYCRVAHALGATAITREVPITREATPAKGELPKESVYGEIGQRCAAIADRNGIDIAFHNHTQINAVTYDSKLLGYSSHLKINFDIGHYVAANDDDPLAIVRKYRDRIASIHVKDRTTKANGQQNLPFGKGDTPLRGLMAMLRSEKWDIPCDIELEYKIPDGSDAVREVGKCNRYCENMLTS